MVGYSLDWGFESTSQEQSCFQDPLTPQRGMTRLLTRHSVGIWHCLPSDLAFMEQAA